MTNNQNRGQGDQNNRPDNQGRRDNMPRNQREDMDNMQSESDRDDTENQ